MDNGQIVVTIHPFMLEQEIFVYVGEEPAQVISCTLETMPERIYTLCERYGIEDVHFHGGQFYAHKFSDQLVMNKFGKKNIKVHIH